MIRIIPSAAEDRPLRLGVIGAGKRSRSYLRDLPDDVVGRVQFVAVCEPDDDAFRAATAHFPGAAPQRYADPYRLINGTSLDALVIAPPNHLHADLAVAAIMAGIPTLLEKPVALTPDSATALWSAHRARPETPVTVGFPLRHTAFYRRVHDLITSGTLGQVLTVDAHELLGTALTKVFHHGWRSDVTRSGGFLVEKCCHDMDILLWLAGSDPTVAFSLAGRDHFRPRPEREQESRLRPDSSVTAAVDFGADRVLASPEASVDPYGRPDSNVDHQSVLFRCAGGQIITFSTAMAQPVTTRRIVVLGTRGEVRGDLESGTLTVRIADDDGGWHESVEHIDAPSGGHHGGDRGIGRTFWDTVLGVAPADPASLAGGLRAAMLAWAGQESAATGAPVATGPLLDIVREEQP